MNRLAPPIATASSRAVVSAGPSPARDIATKGT